jgi:hypothetical protein
MYGYCPAWALDWEYRKQQILKEVLAANCDIVLLQVCVPFVVLCTCPRLYFSHFFFLNRDFNNGSS